VILRSKPTLVSTRGRQEAVRKATPKPEATGAVRLRQRRRKPAELSDVIEGEIAEICRDLAVQVKRIRQLQERTDELRIVIREWTRASAPTSDHEPPDV
jgi:hypothetical protein